MLFAVQMTAALGYTPQITLFFLFPFLLPFSTYYEKPYIRQIFVQLEKIEKFFGDKMEQILVLMLSKKTGSYKFNSNLQN